MANTIKLKRGTSTPSTSDISSGEVAIDTSAQKLYINDSGTVKEIGGSGSSIGGNTGVDFNDSVKTRWGTGNDLEIYHDGTYGWIANGTGDLLIKNDGTNPIRIRSVYNEENIVCYANGTTELYYDGVVKLQTQSWGVLINDQLKLTDSKSLFFGDGNDLQIYHDGSNSSIQNATGKLYLYGGSNQVLIKAVNAENSLTAKPNGAVELYFDNALKLETLTAGVQIWGHLRIPDSDGTTDKLEIGNGQDLTLYHNGSHSFIKNSTGNLQLMSDEFRVKSNTGNEAIIQASLNGSVQLYYDNSKKLETTSDGVQVTGKLGVGIASPQETLHLYAGNTALEIDGPANRYCAVGFSVEGASKWWMGRGDSDVLSEDSFFIGKDTGNAVDKGGSSAKLTIDSSGDTTFAGNVNLPDNKKVLLGTGSDLEIFYDGSSNVFKGQNGPTFFQANSENAIKYSPNGAVELYYDNSKKLETTTTGYKGGDNVKAGFGDDGDLQIYHDGTNSHVNNSTGYLVVGTDSYAVKDQTLNEFYIKALKDGAVELYYDNSKKLETFTNGIDVSGQVRVTASSTGYGSNFHDSIKSAWGDSQDLQIYHDGSNSYIAHTNNTNDLRIRAAYNKLQGANGDNMLVATQDASVILYYDNSQKFETTSTGATITGSLDFPDGYEARFGTGTDLTISHSGSHGIIKNFTGNLYLYAKGTGNEVGAAIYPDAQVELYYDNVKTFATQTNGIASYGTEGNDAYIYLFADEADDLADQWRLRAWQASQTLTIESRNGSGTYETNIECNGDGAVELYYDNSKKLDTNSGGVKIHGNLDVDDNNKLRVGTSSDLQIYHDGSHSYIQDSGTGNLRICGDDVHIQNAAATENIARFYEDGSVELYYNHSKKLETRSDGIEVDGFIYATRLDLDDNEKILVGTGDDLQIFHDGSDSYIKDAGTGILVLQTDYLRVNNAAGNETIINAIQNGAIELYYDNSKRLETTAAGVTIPNTLTVSDGANLDGDIKFKGSGDGDDFFWDKSADQLTLTDSRKIRFGDSGDLQIYANGSASYIAHNGDGDLFISTGASGENLYVSAAEHLILRNAASENAVYCSKNAHVSLYYDNSQKFYTQSYGCVVAGDLKPESNNTYNLGDSSYRWANLYVNDMHFSNEGKSNSVDGTWGDWTLQEGDENIFMINNRTGKKYKMGLQEVN